MEKTIVDEHGEGVSPRDTFLQLWSMVSLYVSAGAFLALMFQYINYFFPDITNRYAFSDDAVRWSTALLIAIFPTHLYVMHRLYRDYIANSKKRVTKLRRWLMYFTLFAAAIMFIVDVAVLVFTFLNGGLSVPFLLKVAVVAVVAIGVFWYYIRDLKQTSAHLHRGTQAVLGMAVLAVALAVIGAFFVSGSPFETRYRKIDIQRVEHLQTVQFQIISYWQYKDRLPQNLDELRDDISGFVPPTDPETGAAYEYEIREPRTFALCGTFSRETLAEGSATKPFVAEPYSMEEHWRHSAGRTCFERVIDPDRYPSLRNAPLKKI